MANFVKVMMERDNMTREEALKEKQMAKEMLWDAMDNDLSSSEVEDMFTDMYGLEPDYIEDILM